MDAKEGCVPAPAWVGAATGKQRAGSVVRRHSPQSRAPLQFRPGKMQQPTRLLQETGCDEHTRSYNARSLVYRLRTQAFVQEQFLANVCGQRGCPCCLPVSKVRRLYSLGRTALVDVCSRGGCFLG
eukprot:4190857-Alexandrium_andersonii.AAC.1